MSVNDTQKQELVKSYEELRRKRMNPGNVQMRGATLLVRRGMSAWIRVWLECEQGREDTVCYMRANAAGDISLPSGVYADTVHVLAAMALNTLQEMGL